MKMWKMAALAAGVLIFAGCGNKAADNSQDGEAVPPEQIQTESKSAGVISSIKDAMGLGKEMKCTYKMKVGSDTIETISYIDGKKYMTETLVAGAKQKMIFDEEAMYSWSEKDKKGMKFTVACMKEMEKNAPETPENNSMPSPDPTGEKTFEDAMDVKCEEVSGANFSIPSDVVFTDQCEMMKNLMKNIPANIPNLPSNLPSNIPNIPGQ